MPTITIYPWMLHDLHLQGAALLVFALWFTDRQDRTPRQLAHILCFSEFCIRKVMPQVRLAQQSCITTQQSCQQSCETQQSCKEKEKNQKKNKIKINFLEEEGARTRENIRGQNSPPKVGGVPEGGGSMKPSIRIPHSVVFHTPPSLRANPRSEPQP